MKKVNQDESEAEDEKDSPEQDHINIKENTADYLENTLGLKSNFQFKFCDDKETVHECVNASITTTIFVSGKEGFAFIDELYKGLAPNTNIVDIIVYCKSIEREDLEKHFNQAQYPITIKYLERNDVIKDLPKVKEIIQKSL